MLIVNILLIVKLKSNLWLSQNIQRRVDRKHYIRILHSSLFVLHLHYFSNNTLLKFCRACFLSLSLMRNEML